MRSKIISITALILVLLSALASHAEWEKLNGPFGCYVADVTVDPTDSQVVYTATDCDGVYKSFDGGITWNTVNDDLPSQSLGGWNISINPDDNQNLFYCSWIAGLFRSADGGLTWEHEIGLDEGCRNVLDIAFTINPCVSLAAAGDAGTCVFKSTDCGSTWETMNNGFPPNAGHLSVATCTQDSLLVYTSAHTGSNDCRFFKSIDGGNLWLNKSTELDTTKYIWEIVVHPTNDNIVYIATENGVYKSIDGAETWQQMNLGLSNIFCRDITLDESNPDNIYVSTWNGLFKSVSAGSSWVRIDSEFVSSMVKTVDLDPTNPQIVYAGVWGGIYKSSDGGLSWTLYDTGLSQELIIADNCLAIDPTNPSVIYAGTYGGGVAKSSDGGNTFNYINNGLDIGYCNGIYIFPDQPERLFCFTKGGDNLYNTIDGGDSWFVSNTGLPQSVYYCGTFDPDDSDVFYVGTDDGIYKTANAGASWYALESLFEYARIRDIAIDPNNSDNIYIAESDSGIFYSQNGGDSWTALSTGITDLRTRAICIDPYDSQKLIAGSLTKIYISIDGGTTWIESSSGIDDTEFRRIIINPLNTQIVYAQTRTQGIYISTNGGSDWEQFNSGINNLFSSAISFDNPANPKSMFIGSMDGVYKRDINLPIYNLNYPAEGGVCYNGPYNGLTDIYTTGVITAISGNSMVLQDDATIDYAGIWVYAGSFDISNLAVDDEIGVFCDVTEYYGLTELVNITDTYVLSTNNTITPTVVDGSDITDACDEDDEAYENMLVVVDDVTIDSAYTYGNYWASDASGDVFIIDNDLLDSLPVSVGNEYLSITGVHKYAYYANRLEPRSADDFQVEALECTATHLIYDIQSNYSSVTDEDNCYPSTYIDSGIVEVCGVVTAVDKEGSGTGLYIQDSVGTTFEGIFWYDLATATDEVDFETAAIGDYYQVRATVSEYNGITELDSLVDFTLLSTNQPLPETTVVTIASLVPDYSTYCSWSGEAYEGVLVKIEDVVVGSTPGYDKWWITDSSSGTDSILLGPDVYDYASATYPPAEGMEYDYIIGVMTYDYYDNRMKILPRMDSDIGLVQPSSMIIHFQTPLGDPYPFDLIISDGEWVQEFDSVTYVETNVPELATYTYIYKLQGYHDVMNQLDIDVAPGQTRELNIYAQNPFESEERSTPYILIEEEGSNPTLSWDYNQAAESLSVGVDMETGKLVDVGVYVDTDTWHEPNYCARSTTNGHISIAICILIYVDWGFDCSDTFSATYTDIGAEMVNVGFRKGLYNHAIVDTFSMEFNSTLFDIYGTPYDMEYLYPQYGVPPGNYILSPDGLPSEFIELEFPVLAIANRPVVLDVYPPKAGEIEPFTYFIAAEYFFANSGYSNFVHNEGNSMNVDVSNEYGHYDTYGSFILPDTINSYTVLAYPDTGGVDTLDVLTDWIESTSGGFKFVVVRIDPSIVHLELVYAEESGYEYLPGDANMAAEAWPAQTLGGDVTYLVNYFRGLADACMLDGFFASADATGDCLVVGGDVTYLVNYFRGLVDMGHCPDYEPAWPTPADVPSEAPAGWPGCE